LFQLLQQSETTRPMNAQTLDGPAVSARATSPGPLAEPGVVKPRSEDQLAVGAEFERVVPSGRSLWRVAILVVTLVAAGFLAFSMMQRRQTENRLFAPASVPVAVADAQVAAGKAKTAAAAARKSAAVVESKVAARATPAEAAGAPAAP
jgi:hypothetical protein